MSRVKEYTLSLQALDWTCRVAIDLDFTYEVEGVEHTMYGILRDSYNFFYNEKDWYATYAPDLIKPWLQVFAEACVAECAGLSYIIIEDVVARFAKMEGWPPLDGSHGIRLTSVDPVDFTGHVWDIEEIEI